MKILIISSACCYPGLAILDDQARKVITRAASEVGLKAEVKIISAATAAYGRILSKPVFDILMSKFNQNEAGPVILINGNIVAYGVPQLDEAKSILQKHIKSEA